MNNNFGYKTFVRWETFWSDRIYNFNGVGNMKFRQQNINNNRSSTNLCTNSGTVSLNDNWSSIGPVTLPSHDLGLISAVEVIPGQGANPQFLVIGSAMGGIYYTSNGGQNWINSTDVLNLPGLGIGDIIYNPVTAKLFAGTGTSYGFNYGAGLLISSDNGITWDAPVRLTSSQDDPNIIKIRFDPNNANIAYILTPFQVFVYNASQPLGAQITALSNTQLNSNIWQAPYYMDMEILPNSNPTQLFLSTAAELGNNGGAKIVKLINPLTNPVPIDLTGNLVNFSADEPFDFFAIDVSNESGFANTLFVVGRSVLNQQIVIQEGSAANSNVSFALLGTHPANTVDLDLYKNEFEVSDVNSNIMYLGGIDLFKSINRGANLSTISPLHVDIRDMQIYGASVSGSTDEIFMGDDGGITHSTDGLSTLIDINGTGLANNLFYGAEAKNARNFFGAQDNMMYNFQSNQWQIFSGAGGDGTHAVFDMVTPNYLTAHLYGSKYYRNAGGVSIDWPSSVSKFWPENEPFVHSSNTYFCGFDEMYIIDDPYGNYCFKRISNFSNYKTNIDAIRSFAVSESNIGRIYVSFNAIYYDAGIPIEGVFFKSDVVNNQYVWQDMTSYLVNFDPDILRRMAISDIVVNPHNENQVWIAFNNFDDENRPQARRVFHSSDGGITWIDFSQGLPNYPISKLIFQNGSNDKTLYLGNDIGVYYRNSSMSQWECYSTGLPVCVIKDLDIDYTAGKIVAATFGHGAYQSPLTGVYNDLPLQSVAVPSGPGNGNPLLINGSVTWDSQKYVSGTLEILPGATLTVKSTVYMSPGSSIIVHRSTSGLNGGKLFVDGGKITVDLAAGTCGSSQKWEGIEVHGFSNLSQGLSLNTKQGTLEIRNNGEISHAQIGAVAGSVSIPGNTGGIIKVRRGTFKDNYNDVLFLPYTNYLFSPSFGIANASYFYECNFITTASEPIASNTTNDPEHVILLGVDGIRFNNSVFKNERGFTSLSNYSNSYSRRGIGIYALNSTFHVGGNCVPPALPDNLPCGQPSTFQNLFYGIYASNSNPVKTTFIRGNSFLNNYHGILLNGINLPSITANNFSIGNFAPNATNPNDLPYGVHLNQCSAYEVEDNMFAALDGNQNSVPTAKVALQISLPDLQEEKIYNNVFQDLANSYGVFVQGLAGDTDPTPSGLQIRCNDFRRACKLGALPIPVEYPTFNIYLTQNGKISAYQGAPILADQTSPAGNTFQNLGQGPGACPLNKHESCVIGFTPYEAEINTQNGLNAAITYFHHTEDVVYATEPMCFTLPDVFKAITPLQYQEKLISCPYQPSIIESTQEHRFRIASNFGESTALKNLIDGGNSSQLLGLIYGNASDGQVKNALLAASPYLSDEVLIAAILGKPTPLSPGALKQILELNSPLSPGVWQAVLQRNPALPPGIINLLSPLQNGISERAKLEAQITEYNLRCNTALNDLLRVYLANDTTAGYLDSVKVLLNTYNYPTKKYLIAGLLSFQKDYALALNLINAELMADPDDNLLHLQKLMIEFEQASNWCYSADTTQKEKLMDIKQSGGKGCVAASAILKEILSFQLPDERIISTSHAPLIGQEEHPVVQKISELAIYPNSVDNYLVIELGENYNGFVKVFSIEGKLISTLSCNKGFGYLETSELVPGIYFIQTVSEEKPRTVKFIIQR